MDGRGSLSQKHLIGFCAFFLEVAIEQANDMQSLLELPNLLARVDAFANRRIQAKTLPRASDRVLREMLIVGEIERNAIAGITGYSDRQARTIIASLTQQNLIGSNTPYGPLSLRFPHAIVEDYFPQLYPPTVGR